MTALNSAAAPPPAAPREYDSEITDMAAYTHNYKVDSPLAVRDKNSFVSLYFDYANIP